MQQVAEIIKKKADGYFGQISSMQFVAEIMDKTAVEYF